MDTEKNTTAPALRTTFDDLGSQYGLVYTGREFEPEFTDGDTLIFSTSAPHKSGDVIALWLRPEAMGNRPQVSVWRVEMVLGVAVPFSPHPDSEVHPVLMVRSAADGKARAIRAEDILGIHRKVGVHFGSRVAYDADEGEVA